MDLSAPTPQPRIPAPAAPAYVFEQQLKSRPFKLQILAAALRLAEMVAVWRGWLPHPFAADLVLQFIAQQWGLMVTPPRTEWNEDDRIAHYVKELRARGYGILEPPRV